MDRKLEKMINDLVNDFENCDGGSTEFNIDGHKFHTDTCYAMDGIHFFAQVLKERLRKTK